MSATCKNVLCFGFSYIYGVQLIRYIKQISKIGALPNAPHSFENKRIVLLNIIALFGTSVQIALMIAHLFVGNIIQSIAISCGFLITIPVIFLQARYRYSLARAWLMLGLLLQITFLFVNSLDKSLDTNTEYVLVILIPMILIFLDGKASMAAAVFVLLCGAAFIMIRYNITFAADDKFLFGRLANWFTISGSALFCIAFFKKSVVYINKSLEVDKAKLQDADRSKNLLFGIISHDIRSPLNTLKQYLLLDPEHRKDPSQFEVYQQGLVKKIDEISNTLNDLLYWSKTQLKGSTTNPRFIDLQETVHGILPVIRETIKLKRIKFSVEDTSDQRIWCDPDHLSVILRNLIQNALKFTPEEGMLTIKAFGTSTSSQIIIMDNGKGMDPTTLKNLQEGMIVESHLGTSGEVGTGLGLSLVQQLVFKNNGKMHIESIQNQGTSITISFPLQVKS